MKKVLLASAILMATASFVSAKEVNTAPVSALNGFYVSPKLGLTHEKNADLTTITNSGSDSSNTYNIGLAAGFDFNTVSKFPVRAEL